MSHCCVGPSTGLQLGKAVRSCLSCVSTDWWMVSARPLDPSSVLGPLHCAYSKGLSQKHLRTRRTYCLASTVGGGKGGASAKELHALQDHKLQDVCAPQIVHDSNCTRLGIVCVDRKGLARTQEYIEICVYHKSNRACRVSVRTSKADCMQRGMCAHQQC